MNTHHRSFILISVLCVSFACRGSSNQQLIENNSNNNTNTSVANYNQQQNTNSENTRFLNNNSEEVKKKYIFKDFGESINKIIMNENEKVFSDNELKDIFDSLSKDYVEISVNSDKKQFVTLNLTNLIPCLTKYRIIDTTLISQYNIKNIVNIKYDEHKPFTRDSNIGKKIITALKNLQVIKQLADEKQNNAMPNYLDITEITNLFINSPEINNQYLINPHLLHHKTLSYICNGYHINYTENSPNSFETILEQTFGNNNKFTNDTDKHIINIQPLADFFYNFLPFYQRHAKTCIAMGTMTGIIFGMYLQYRFGHIFSNLFNMINRTKIIPEPMMPPTVS